MISLPATNTHVDRTGSSSLMKLRPGVFDPVGLFLRRWPWVVISAAAGLLAAWSYLQSVPPIYESQAEILVIQKDARIPAQPGGTETGFAESPGEEVLATHMQILSSPRIVQEAIIKASLDQRPSLQAVATSASWPASLSSQDRIVRYILNHLRVRKAGEGATRDARVVLVTFQHTSPEDCRDVLAAIIGSYETFVESVVQDAGDSALHLIHNARDDLKEQVERDDAAYRQYVHQAEALITDGAALNPHQVMLQQFESQLADIRLRKSEAAARRQIVERALETADHEQQTNALLAVIGNADLARLNMLLEVEFGQPASEAFQALQPTRHESARAEFDKLWNLRLDVLKKSQLLGEAHPKRQELEKQVAELEEYLRVTKAELPAPAKGPSPNMITLAQTYLKLLTFDLSELDRREEELKRLASAERESAKQLVEVAQKAASLYRNLQNSQLLYEKVVNRLGEVNLLRDYAGFITEVIAPAQLGDIAWPKAPLLLALGLILGATLGTSLAAVRDLTDRRFRGITDIEFEMSLPVLARIARLPLDQSRAIASARRNQISPEVVAHHCPESATADEIRELRSAIHFQCRATPSPIVQITSENIGEGKSILVANLAASFAQMGQRVLIIDCDLRRPRQHELWGVTASSGIGHILHDSDPLLSAVVATPLSTLKLVPGDRSAGITSDQLSSARLANFLSSARTSYDVILLDTPPVMESSDPLLLASCVDYTLLVVSLEKPRKLSGVIIRNRLLAHGAKLLGLVVNAPNVLESRSSVRLVEAASLEKPSAVVASAADGRWSNGRKRST